MNVVFNQMHQPRIGIAGGYCKSGVWSAALLLSVGILLYCTTMAENATADTKKAAASLENAATGESETNALQRFTATKVEMAVPIIVVLYADNPATANAAFQAVFDCFNRLNAVMSDYDKNSELRRLCDTAGSGRAIPVSNDLWVVLTAAVEIARQSNGAFDPTISPVVKLWRRARRRGEMPDADKLAQARQLVDYRLMRFDEKNKTIELLKPGMQIDLGGIATGYALDEAMKALYKLGITRVLIDASGDILLGDPPPGKQGWTVGVARLDPKAPPSRYLSLSRLSIITSGDAWQYVEIGGRRYSHLIDPHTGLGLTDHSSVTVIAPTAIVADGLSSAVSVLGPKAGLQLVESIPEAAAFIVRAPEGKPETYESRRWKNYDVVKK